MERLQKKGRIKRVDPLLIVDQLEISSKALVPLMKKFSFQIFPREIVALTGASGCGKSLTANAVVGLLEDGCEVTNGRIYYKGQSLSQNDEKSWQTLRRDEISLLIQHSLSGLNPLQSVKKQMLRTLKQKTEPAKKERMNYLRDLLRQVGFSNPERILSSYPFQLSGGMCQRILLAMMISLQPTLLIADEPTTALDSVNKEKLLALLKKLQQEHGLTILLISHDVERISAFADRIIDMEAREEVRTCFLNYKG